MLGNSIISIKGNIPDDLVNRITKISNQFYDLVYKLVMLEHYDRKIIRLLKPANITVVLDDNFIHYVLTNKNVGGVIKVRHIDLRGKGTASLKEAIEIVERDLAFFEDGFGFSIPSTILTIEEITDEQLLIYAEKYCKEEVFIHERLARIVRINPIFKGRDFLVSDNICFVLMPFGQENHLQEIYIDNIKPIVNRMNFNCKRADDIYSNEPIVETIWENINSARIIIAELTGKNPNVFYKLGIAHTVGKEVILLSQNIEDVPFDLRHLRVILYDVTPRGVKNLEKQLELTIKAIEKKKN